MGRGLGYKNLGLQAYGREYDLLYPGSDHELPSVPVTFLIALTKILYEIKDSELEYSLAGTEGVGQSTRRLSHCFSR